MAFSIMLLYRRELTDHCLERICSHALGVRTIDFLVHICKRRIPRGAGIYKLVLIREE